MTENEKIKKIQSLSKSVNLISLSSYLEKYFNKFEKRQLGRYYFKKENQILIGGTFFIIDKDPFSS